MKGLTYSNGQPFLKTDHMSWGGDSLEKALRDRTVDMFGFGAVLESGAGGSSPFIISPSAYNVGLYVDVGQGLGYAPAFSTWPMTDAEMQASGRPVASTVDVETGGERILIHNTDTSLWDISQSEAQSVSDPHVCTISVSSPADITWPAHNSSVGDTVSFTTTGALPTGLSPSINYYVVEIVSVDIVRVSSVRGGAGRQTTVGGS